MIDHRKGLAAAVRKGGVAAGKLYKAENPDAELLRIRADVAAFKPRPKAMAGYAIRLAELFLGERSYLGWTNAALAKHISADELGYNVPANLLTERFRSSDKAKVAALLSERGISIAANLFDSPSKLKRALSAYRRGNTATQRVTTQVAFSADCVVVDGRSYPINGAGRLARVQVGKGKLNVVTLRHLLQPR